ncbi:MAG: hypothetical protein QM535_16005 [Limnohabitans sp.]|nr:hypothetical protein [Limnohabitans sp.]
MRIILYSLLFFSLFACKEKHPYPRVIMPKQKNVIRVNSKGMLHRTFLNGVLSNFINDSTLNEKSKNKYIKEDYIEASSSDTILPRYDFKIIVDTSYVFSQKGFEYYNAPLPDKRHLIMNGLLNGKIPNNAEIDLSTKAIEKFSKSCINQSDKYLECYPLLIFNNENEVALVNEIELIQEAKDVDGKWKPIEFFRGLPYCVGHNVFFKHKPKQYSLVPMIKYYGDYNTKLRVKVRIRNNFYYSNEFFGRINRSQFNLDYMRKYINLFETINPENSKEYEDYVLLRK